jgi:hypothetical protein
MSVPKTGTWPRLTLLAGILPLAVPALAGDFTLADGEVQGSWKLRATAGAGVRTADPSRHLVGKGFRSDGKAKGGDGSDTSDDGNLNFGKGDVYSAPGRVLGSMDLKYGNIGIDVSARAWYDYALERRDVPQGNVPNGFRADTPLEDTGFSRSNRFSGFMWLDAYVYGHADLGGSAGWDVRVGRQRVKWGEGLFFNGLNQVNPFDYTTLHRPGVDPASEAQLPVEMVWNKLVFLDGKASVEGFWQWKWRPTELDPCGTFFSGTDLGINAGCSGLQSNAYYPINAYSAGAGQWLSDGFMYDAGAYLPRGTDRPARDSGQWGLALHYKTDGGTDIGLYHLRYNARLPILDATTPDSARTDATMVDRLTAAGVPLAYAQLSQRLSTITESWEYPDGIRLSGLSAARKAGAWKFAGEASYSPNMPVQLNTADMFAALTRNGGPIGARTLGQPEGFLLRGYDRFSKFQAQASAVRTLGPRWGAQSGSLAAEAMWSHVNLPSLAQARYGRGFAWGYSPQGSDGSCGEVQNPRGCVNDGFYTKMAWGYRIKGQLDYALAHGVSLSPSLTWGQDVHGYSVDGALVGGRQSVVLGVGAKFAGRWSASLAWTRYLHDDGYDVLADHDNVVVAAGVTF